MGLFKKSYIESIDELLDELEEFTKRADQHDDANVKNYENTQSADVENTGPRGREDDKKTTSPATGPATIKNAPKVESDYSHDTVKVEGTQTADDNAEIRPKQVGPNETINEKEAKKAFFQLSEEVVRMGQQLVNLINAKSASLEQEQTKQASDQHVDPSQCPICAVIAHAYETGSELAKNASAISDEQVADLIRDTIAEARAAARLTAQGIAEAEAMMKQAIDEVAAEGADVSPEEVAAAIEALEGAEEPEIEDVAGELAAEEGGDEEEIAAALEDLIDAMEAEEAAGEEAAPEEEALADAVAEEAAKEAMDMFLAKQAADLLAEELESSYYDSLLSDIEESLLKEAEDELIEEAIEEALFKQAMDEIADAVAEEEEAEDPEAMEDEAIQDIIDAVEALQEAQAMEEAEEEAPVEEAVEEVKEAIDRQVRKEIARQFIDELIRRS